MSTLGSLASELIPRLPTMSEVDATHSVPHVAPAPGYEAE